MEEPRSSGNSQGGLELYRLMVRIRSFEEKLSELFKRGELPGFVHLYIGQEAVAVGTCSILREQDRITSTHRGHGHVMAKGGDVYRMMAEILGRQDGYCSGRGGSMHIMDFSIGVLGTNGIVGGGLPAAAGAALADAYMGRDNVTVAFFGDGASNQGVFLEVMNLASIWSLPLVLLCENNGYSEWTPTEELTAGSIADRAAPLGIPGRQVDGNDVFAVRSAVREAVDRARSGDGPSLIEALTYRWHGHNEGEEAFSGQYRPDEEVASWKGRDPITRLAESVLASDQSANVELERIADEERSLVEEAYLAAAGASFPDADSALTDVFAPAAEEAR